MDAPIDLLQVGMDAMQEPKGNKARKLFVIVENMNQRIRTSTSFQDRSFTIGTKPQSIPKNVRVNHQPALF